jgi:hypothetical protein
MINNNNKLIFKAGNAKLSKSIATFSLPAGHTCPFAKECLSKANRLTGKIVDGQHCKFRCFSASQEVRPTVRHARWENFDKLREAETVDKMARLIQRSIPWGLNIVRNHVSGDYYSEKYFLAWLNVAKNNPSMTIYGYTKATPFLVEYRKYIPPNFRFTASKGGTCDNLISKHRLKFAEVVYSEQAAIDKDLEIDHDDMLALKHEKNFALLIHGTQPPGTEASRAWVALMRQGKGGYSKKGTYRRGVHEEKPLTIYITLKGGEIYLPQRVKGFKYSPSPTGKAVKKIF